MDDQPRPRHRGSIGVMPAPKPNFGGTVILRVPRRKICNVNAADPWRYAKRWGSPTTDALTVGGYMSRDGGGQSESTLMKQTLVKRDTVLYMLDMELEVFQEYIEPYLSALEFGEEDYYDPDEVRELIDNLWGKSSAVVLEFVPKDRGGDSESTPEN